MYHSLNTTVLLVFGILALGIHPSTNMDVAALMLTGLLTMASMIGLGLVEVSFFGIYEFRFSQTPLNHFIGVFSPLLSGVMFPVSMLPEWAQKISAVLPHTYIYEAFRQIFIQGASLYSPSIQHCLTTISLFSAILMSLGILCYKLGISKTEKEGILSTWT